jgi:hypothetical protein
MRTEREPKLREAGQPVRPKARPALTLIKSTTPPLPSSPEMPPEVKEMFREMSEKKKRVVSDSDTPDAA